MTVQYFKFIHESGSTSIIRRDADGDWWLGLGEQDEKFQTWCAEGNEPDAWPEPVEEVK